jgi:hypothetical protein
MTKKQNIGIQKATKQLIVELRKLTEKETPFTIFCTIWDDGDYLVIIRSFVFFDSQSIEMQKEDYTVRAIEISTISRHKERGIHEFRIKDEIITKSEIPNFNKR